MPDLTPSPSFDLFFPRATTSQEVLERSSYALAQLLTTTVSSDGKSWLVTIHPRSTHKADELAHRYRQEVVDQALRVRIAERTDPIRTLVFALAFSRSSLAGESDS